MVETTTKEEGEWEICLVVNMVLVRADGEGGWWEGLNTVDTDTWDSSLLINNGCSACLESSWDQYCPSAIALAIWRVLRNMSDSCDTIG